MPRARHATALLLAALAALAAGPARSQFNPLSGIVSAIEAAAEDRGAADIAADAKIKTVIVARLADKLGREGALLGVDVYEQDVMLTGAVPLAEIKAAAGKIAAGAEGVKKVLNEVLLESALAEADKGKSSANLVDDTVIEAKIKALYLEGKGINATNWRWRSVKGRVFLFGRALSKDEHEKAARIAKDVSGVVSVVNRAKIKPKS
jgi:osmotically-inducible protein OsmY